MNDPEADRQAARAERDRQNASALAEIGIAPAEAALFNVLHFGLNVPPSDLCRRAAAGDYSVGAPATADDIHSALDGCFAKGWLQIVDQSVLAGLQDEVRRQGLLGPIYDYPDLGGVDFTYAGAEQWQRICERLWNGGASKSYPFRDVVHEKTAHYFRSESAAFAECERSKSYDGVIAVAGPVPIGPWRANWWRRFPQGFRIDVEERNQWRGRGSSCGASVYFNLAALPVDLAHAKEVLNRHNIHWAEWLVLASREDAAARRTIASKVALHSKRMGTNLTERDCLDGIEACLSHGWLRYVDNTVTAEIENLLSTDSAFMPVPFEAAKHCGSIDFSAAGAELHRMLSAEIYGPDWEDSVQVEDTYYLEEHRYCASEAGLARVRQDFALSGETPKSIHTVPIGPWCVFWWERFGSGYRMELTFGEP